jgi:hypothetical protein
VKFSADTAERSISSKPANTTASVEAHLSAPAISSVTESSSSSTPRSVVLAEASTVKDVEGHSFYVYVVEPSLFAKFIRRPTNNSGTDTGIGHL